MGTDAQRNLTEAISEELKEMAVRDDEDPNGTVTRYVVLVETLKSEETRRLTYIASAFDGTGLYPWETLGMVEYFNRHYDQGDD